MADIEELIERLRATWKHDGYVATSRTAPPIKGEIVRLVNPDGPEAATALSAQQREIAELREALEKARSTLMVASNVLYSVEAYQTSNLCDDDAANIEAALNTPSQEGERR